MREGRAETRGGHCVSEEHDHSDGKITCEVCGARTHFMQKHLQDAHPEITIEDYRAKYPSAPILSPLAEARVREHQAKAVAAAPVSGVESPASEEIVMVPGALHEAFHLGSVKAAINARTGAPLPISTFKAPPALALFVPAKDPHYVFQIDLLKSCIMALEINTPMLTWGHMGTGKSTIWEQIAAHTGRPMLRVQHTRNVEESHVVGQWTVKDGRTVFELGPLAFAMKYGLLYVADEYDFAMPAVLSVYQAVLEGKPLLIKEADAENRIIKPHPHFRIVATGNTNGTGDETGLYQGTLLQNAANYERFGIVEQVEYMEKKIEIQVVAAQGGVPKEIAETLVQFGTMCREAFKAAKISLPPSPRALINAAKVGVRRGDFAAGLRLAYINRLSTIDREAANDVLRRITFSV